MSVTMAGKGGWVQLQPSDIHLGLNMAKMAKGWFLRAPIEETQQLIKKPHAKVQEKKKRGVEFPGHNNVRAAIERHPAIVCENQMDGSRPCQNGTPIN